MEVDAFVAGHAAKQVLDGAAVSHELMRLHQGQIHDGVGVEDGFGQKQPLQRATSSWNLTSTTLSSERLMTVPPAAFTAAWMPVFSKAVQQG